jgi:hypothetical protein
MQQKPTGYEGINHETIGSDILAVLETVTLREHVLGGEVVARLRQIDPNGWYPIQELIDLMTLVEARLGHTGLRKMGRVLFALSHQKRVQEVAKSAKDIIYGVNDMYLHANRGQEIGGWKVLEFRPGRATLEKNTPHHCVMEEGILASALVAIGVPSIVSQTACFREGAGTCLYKVTSVIADRRWSGA